MKRGGFTGIIHSEFVVRSRSTLLSLSVRELVISHNCLIVENSCDFLPLPLLWGQRRKRQLRMYGVKDWYLSVAAYRPLS